jgi:adenylosuccinate lyase
MLEVERFLNKNISESINMSVHPIEFRYFSDEMKSIFTEEAKLQNWLTVEAALARAHARLGHIPKSASAEISRKATLKHVRLRRVKAIEDRIHHDLMAMVKTLTEVCAGGAGKYVHLGATSYDIEDTALALQLGSALAIIARQVDQTGRTLLKLAQKTKRLVCVGRTHGQHAVPTTYGLKFAIYACEFQRHLDRLAEARKRIMVGQMTGAVGTQASFGKDARKLQQIVMNELGLKPVHVSNQVIQRDRHAEVVFCLALAAASAEKIAKEIRNLQRTEIGEVFEPFGSGQVGSSTMPQKRNPHKSERICSIARIVRAQIIPALENISLEHERDLTNSAAERVIFPEAFILTDYVLRQLRDILGRLVISEKNIRRNLSLTGGMIMSERVMMELVERGMGRQEAHELLRRAAGEAFTTGRNFRDVLLDSGRLALFLKAADLDRCLKPESYIGTAVAQVEKVLAQSRGKKANRL